MKKPITNIAEQFVAEIRRFNELVTDTVPVDDAALKELSGTLSSLLNLGEQFPDAWSETELEAPEIDGDKTAKMIADRFPEFSYYNTISPEYGDVDNAIISVNDAADDLFDIYRDVNESLWYFDNDEPALCLWSAKNLFGHWGRHAINLKSYIHKHIHDW